MSPFWTYYKHKQQYGLHLKKLVHTNLPLVEFELGSLRQQAGVLPIEPPLLFRHSFLYNFYSLKKFLQTL